jgi:chromosomal replication initiation ATPase DnaA
VTAGVDFLWRYSIRDGFYQPPGVPLVPSSANTQRFLGEQYNLHAEWQATAHINVNAVYVHFTPAGFLKSAGAKGIDYPRHMGRPRCFEHPIAFGHREVLIRGYVHGVVICCGAQDDRHGGISIAHAASNASEQKASKSLPTWRRTENSNLLPSSGESANLASCEWIREHHHLCLIGPTSIGKSWLACALGHKACRKGLSVLYETASMTRILGSSRLRNKWTSQTRNGRP